jgi:O-antigen/teichoic acid export membrane protein
VFYGFYLFYNTTLLFKNKQKLSLIINLFVAAFTIALNFLIIPHFGMKGAAWSTFVSYLALFIFIKSISSIWYKHPSNFWKEIIVIFSMISAVGVVYYCYQLNIPIYLKAASSLFIGILYICGLQLSGYISIRFLKQQFQTLLRARKSTENE